MGRITLTVAMVGALLFGSSRRPAGAEQNERPGSAAQASIAAGDRFTCAIVGEVSVRCWGLNATGSLGLGNVTPIGDDEIPTTNVNLAAAKPVAISAGAFHTCALLAGGAVRCWGYGLSGQLGIGNNADIGDDEDPTADVRLGSPATAIATGDYHTCALLTGGTVRCWGNNANGQLGLGNIATIGDNEDPTQNVNFHGATATAITAGAAHTCALLTGGSVRCWGNNYNGRLGLPTLGHIGDNEDPTENVNLHGATAIAISAGNGHTCALLTGGDVRCWGWNYNGQLGLGNNSTIGDDEDPTQNVNLHGATATAIAAGHNHTCVLLTTGAVRCWGANYNGQLGLANFNNIGDDEDPTENVNLGGATAIAITAGDSHTCAVLSGGAVRCWGQGSLGQLGLGNTNWIGDDESPTDNVPNVLVGPDTQRPVIAIAAPAPGQSVPGSPVIQGVATDDGGIAGVQVAVYRNAAGGQYWNGATWQAANVTVPATMTKPNSTTTSWTYEFNGPPAGVFAVAAVATDATGNTGTAAYQTFSIADPSGPAVTLRTPTSNQAFAGVPVTITGTATDNIGISEVRLAIHRPVSPNGQFWNGTTWQTTYATVDAVLARPGSPTTAFTYAFTPPQNGGYYNVAAIAIDTSYNYSLTPFTAFTLPDTTPPTGSSNAVRDITLTPPITRIVGAATDDNTIAAVGIAIYRSSTAEYWNGRTWQAGFTTVPANLDHPGTASTGFRANFAPAPLEAYYIAALIVDGNFNYVLTTFTGT